MKVEKDYEDLLKLFNKNKVKYCIVGAYAVAFYGRPRYTKDMDILIEPEVKNAEKIVNALNEFGFKNCGLQVKDFTEKGRIIQLGYEPIRVDIITSILKVNFEDIWKNKKKGAYGNQGVFFIALKDLIKIKKMSSRRQESYCQSSSYVI